MNIYLCLFAEYREFDTDGGTSMDVIGFLRILAVVDYLHLCIYINTYHNRNDGGLMVSTRVAEKMVPGIMSRRWNANFWLYFNQASLGA